MKYARVLLGHCPRETTQLFIDYYTGRYRPKKEAELPVKTETQSGSAVQNLAALLPLPYVGTGGTKAQPSEAQVTSEEKSLDVTPTYEIPKPRTAFSAFVDHPDEFITFLEALIKQESLKKEDKIDLYTTLFEMYLDTAKRKKDASERQEWENKAKKLIEGKDVRVTSISENIMDLTQSTDTYLNVQCSPTLRPVQLPGGNNTRQGARRPALRHIPFLHRGEGHSGCD